MERNRKLQLLFGVGLMLISLSHWFPSGIHIFELLAAFAHLTMVLSVMAAVISARFRLPILGGFAILSVLLSGVLVTSHFSILHSHKTADFTIGQFNLYHNNPTPELAIAELKKLNADVFTIQELNQDWKPFVELFLEEKYPYQIEEPWSECCYGIGLYSKYPIIKSKIFFLEGIPVIHVTINVNGGLIDVVSLHTLPPAFPNQTEERNRQLESTAQLSNSLTNPYVVLGDFNIVPWDKTFTEFLTQAKLSVVRSGFQATYPMHFGIPLIPIDHIMHSSSLEPTECSVVSIPGSDHRGILVSFSLVKDNL